MMAFLFAALLVIAAAGFAAWLIVQLVDCDDDGPDGFV